MASKNKPRGVTPSYIPVRLNPPLFRGPRSLTQIMAEQQRWLIWEVDGVKPWVHNPHWAQYKKPDLAVAQELLEFYVAMNALPRHLNLEFLTGGAYHELFRVMFEENTLPQTVILRVSKPSDPYYTLESEVATMMMAATLGIPVPRIYSFDSSAQNPLGLEWSLMEFIQGSSFEDWDYASGNSSDSLRILGQLASHLETLRSVAFSQIGNLYFDWVRHAFFVGPVVDSSLIRNAEAAQAFDRSP
jgi:Phosphotransferase enzyme family